MPYNQFMHRRGTLYFDAGCGLCSEGARRWERMVGKRGFEVVPLQDPRAEKVLNLAPGELPTEIKLETADGRILGGVDAFAYVGRYVWWAFPLHLLASIPPVRDLLVEAYKPIARHRTKISSACGLKPMIAR